MMATLVFNGLNKLTPGFLFRINQLNVRGRKNLKNPVKVLPIVKGKSLGISEADLGLLQHPRWSALR